MAKQVTISVVNGTTNVIIVENGVTKNISSNGSRSYTVTPTGIQFGISSVTPELNNVHIALDELTDNFGATTPEELAVKLAELSAFTLKTETTQNSNTEPMEELIEDLNTIKFEITLEKTNNPNINDDEIVENPSGSAFNVYGKRIKISIYTKKLKYLDYSNILTLERYKPKRTRYTGSYSPLSAGFVKENFHKHDANSKRYNPFNRVNEFNINSVTTNIDIKPQTYFRLRVADIANGEESIVKPIGIPNSYTSSRVETFQIFRFTLKTEINGVVIKKFSLPFKIRLITNKENKFYYGLGR